MKNSYFFCLVFTSIISLFGLFLITYAQSGLSYDRNFIISTRLQEVSDTNSPEYREAAIRNQAMSDWILSYLQQTRKDMYTFLGIPEKSKGINDPRHDFHISINPTLKPGGKADGYTSPKDHPDRKFNLIWITLPSHCTPDELRCVLSHEGTHALVRNVIGDHTRLSPFENEGIATAFERYFNDTPALSTKLQEMLAKQLFNTRKIPSILTLSSKKTFEPSDYNSYAIAQSFFTFLLEMKEDDGGKFEEDDGKFEENDGGKFLGRFLECRRDSTFKKCITEVYGIRPAAIDQTYRKWLQSRYSREVLQKR